MLTMNKEPTWTNLFFSNNPPEFIQELNNEANLQSFHPKDENWKLGRKADKGRQPDPDQIQVFWLPSHGHRKYIAKVFPEYTEQQATAQLRRLRIPQSHIPNPIHNAVHEFDRFSREARAYAHIDRFCSTQERIYFPRFYGVMIDVDRSKFSSGYPQQRAIILEAIKPDIRSRRILAESTSLPPETHSEISSQTLAELSMSPFEHEWYLSLLHDRLRRLSALHRMGITHGDVQDWHFRIPDDFRDTVLYDFSEAYAFSPRSPLWVNHGKPRPLSRIAEGERRSVELQIEERAKQRDLRSHLIKSSPEPIVDNALWQPLDKEEGMLELIILKVWSRPDDFTRPTLSSVLPFLEYLGRKSDPGWHIRRARLLARYESVWAIPHDDENDSRSTIFQNESPFETVHGSHFLLCLIPKSWGVKDPVVRDKL